MSEAIFIFQDNECEMAVAVRDCDDDKAMQMLYTALTSGMALPLSEFDALEFATLFVAVNKKSPYDILFCGEFEDDQDFEGISNVYDCACNGEALVVTPMEFDSRNGCKEPQSMWQLKQITMH